MFVTYSGPETGCGSGTAPGHIGNCVCPGDGRQTFVCAFRLPHANTVQATNNTFAIIPLMVLVVKSVTIRACPLNRSEQRKLGSRNLNSAFGIQPTAFCSRLPSDFVRWRQSFLHLI